MRETPQEGKGQSCPLPQKDMPVWHILLTLPTGPWVSGSLPVTLGLSLYNQLWLPPSLPSLPHTAGVGHARERCGHCRVWPLFLLLQGPSTHVMGSDTSGLSLFPRSSETLWQLRIWAEPQQHPQESTGEERGRPPSPPLTDTLHTSLESASSLRSSGWL